MNIGNLISLIGIGLTLLSNGFMIAMVCVVKFNDLTHLSKGLEEIKTKIDDNDKRLDLLSERVSNIEGKLSK